MPDIPWKIRTVVTTEVGTDVDQTIPITGGTGTVYETPPAVAASTTSALIPMAFTTASIKGYTLKSDKNCTLKIDSSGSPTGTITLVAGVNRVFPGETNAFAVDVLVGIYITNGSGAVANVSLHILHS